MTHDPRLPADSRRPAWGDLSDRKFFTSRGWLTPYSLACGYIEVRGNDESGARLCRDSEGFYRVTPTGRWTRSPGRTYASVLEARAAFAKLDHQDINAKYRQAALVPIITEQGKPVMNNWQEPQS